ncbi:hypothetical protein KC878_01935 [Candidatus Saccharibacteria bacterium]|nr:hypothetical protein [Candidatus Saccharibacteria bacterium]MCB9821518.1 hypothetical protein [Candidatus Nomurabacteria bacterium]
MQTDHNLANPTYEDLKKYYLASKHANYKTFHIVLAILVLLATLPAVSNPTQWLISLLISELAIAGIIRVIRWSVIKSKRNSYIFQDIASKNQLTFVSQYVAPINGLSTKLKMFQRQWSSKTINTSSDVSNLPINQKGVIFNSGDTRAYTNIIGNGTFAIYDYAYSTGSGKNRTRHYWRVASWQLSRPLPHLLFDAKKNNVWKFTNLPAAFDSSQKVSLEANFDDHFSLYSPENYNVDTLSFITPEIMDYLIRELDGFDIEIIDGQIFIYSGGTVKPNEFWQLYAKLYGLAKHLEDNIDSYRDQRVTQFASTGTDRVQIAQQGLRLKRSKLPAFIGVMTTFLYITFRSTNGLTELSNGFILAIFGIGIATFVYAIIAVNKFRNK